MSKRSYRQILPLLLILLILSVSCLSMPGAKNPWVAAEDEFQDLDRVACDGTSSLAIIGTITSQGTNQYGTRYCEYSYTIKNNQEDTGVRVYFYQHDQDGYAHTEKFHWMGNIPIKPGQEGSWTGSVYIYDDPDADGPLMSIPEKVAGVLDLPECADEKQDEKFFERIAIPVEAVCPIE